MKTFDLNIEEILENWEIHHAIREIISNALDEQILSCTQNIKIEKTEDKIWNIKDFGRGLQYEHLTQNENVEKLKHPHLIGKFGVGLKDALATFYRHKIDVTIKSKFCDISLGMSPKINFDDVITLHAYVKKPSSPLMSGTEFILSNCEDFYIKQAKSFFLKFSSEIELEKTKYGSVLQKTDNEAKIYINGVKVATERNFLFSYNITSLNKKIKDALNRERNNVGRNAYSERIKSILLQCKEKEVSEKLVDDLQNFETGKSHDELSWTNISIHATKLLNSHKRVVFFTPNELENANDFIDRAKNDGFEIVPISEKIKDKVSGQKDYNNNPIVDLNEYVEEWSESFEFEFIEKSQLTSQELEIYETIPDIFKLIGGKPPNIKEVKISETMRPSNYTLTDAAGVWNGSEIIIRRFELISFEKFASILLHETAHAISGASDISINFEETLTDLLGKIAVNILKIDITKKDTSCQTQSTNGV